ncbi:DUF1800 domain-containing protein [Pokkaliibacter plantistimulans]|uniref:DUF1800 domain-containing protein n=1 Tax=Proteobacteria bacterium 228 TaxID=2083153 RepID=A0A2S5KI09_9PROT|nr:DUF1800 domain-containing protein [Pokkaliibacter plantistimulans]PPC74457.1 DUF1800 domain-containing protein [Pokkaliibacter plantistimulans]
MSSLATFLRGGCLPLILLVVTSSAEASPPACIDRNWPPTGQISPDKRVEYAKEIGRCNQDLKAAWVEEMRTDKFSEESQMIIFWHNHFTSSVQKVRPPNLIWQQHELISRYAMGNFRVFLHAIAKDPAMLMYLDGNKNIRNAPNENFAREVLELFTLGEGHYTEQDVKQAAKAFTGWQLNRQRQFVFNLKQHDDSDKTFMGHSGKLNGDDILDIVLNNPETAHFITEKLWTYWVGKPAPQRVNQLAEGFYQNYEIADLVDAIKATDEYRNRPHNQVKSPVELLIPTLVKTNSDLPSATVAKQLRTLGQDLFNPPNVKGWPSGNDWLTSTYLIDRQKILAAYGKQYGKRLSDQQQACSTDALADLMPAIPLRKEFASGCPQKIVQWLTDPSFQLK